MVQREEHALIQQHGPHDLLKRLPQVRAIFPLQPRCAVWANRSVNTSAWAALVNWFSRSSFHSV